MCAVFCTFTASVPNADCQELAYLLEFSRGCFWQVIACPSWGISLMISGGLFFVYISGGIPVVVCTGSCWRAA